MVPVKHSPNSSDPVFASSAPHSDRQFCLQYQGSPPVVHDLQLHPHRPPFVSPSGLPTMEHAHSREYRGSTSSGDMDRGLAIDFYQVGDHRLLASWASYFRDQCVQARSDLDTLQRSHDHVLDQLRRRDADLLVKTIDENGFLDSREMHDLFRKKSFTIPMSAGSQPKELFETELTSQFATGCLESIFAKVATMQDALQVQQFLPFDTPEWRESLWFQHGLKELVGKARIKFSHFYSETIRQSVDACFTNQKTRNGQEQQSKVARELLSATRVESEEVVAQRRLLPIYAQVIVRLGCLTVQEGDSTATGEKDSPKKRQYTDQQQLFDSLEGKPVKDFFSPKEESFLRLVIRKYLPVKFGSELVNHSDEDDMEEPEDFAKAGLDRYSQKDMEFLFAMCEKLFQVHDTPSQGGDASGVFHAADLAEMSASWCNKNDGSPGKRARRRACVDDDDAAAQWA